MDTAGIFHNADSRTGYSDLWEITWERIDCFLPKLRDELFKQTVIQGMYSEAHIEPMGLRVKWSFVDQDPFESEFWKVTSQSWE